MRQLLLAPMLLVFPVLSGCFWNTKLPYQESMDTYVDSSQTLLVQVRKVPKMAVDSCKLYRLQAYHTGLPTEDDCNPDIIIKQASDINEYIDAAISYHTLLEKHSPEHERYRGSQSITDAGETVSTECVKEGSKCNFDWISGTRLTVIQEAFSALFTAYLSEQNHDALIRYLSDTSQVYLDLMTNVENYLVSIEPVLDSIKDSLESYRTAYCDDGSNRAVCDNKGVLAFLETYKERVEVIEALRSQLKAHNKAHETFKLEVMANESSDARKEKLIAFAKEVLQTGYRVHEAF